jgi:hypothetical protein
MAPHAHLVKLHTGAVTTLICNFPNLAELPQYARVIGLFWGFSPSLAKSEAISRRKREIVRHGILQLSPFLEATPRELRRRVFLFPLRQADSSGRGNSWGRIS